jgi:hypothetical protein
VDPRGVPIAPEVRVQCLPTTRKAYSPETGKIAVKVINHYGEEVMKVYDLSSSTL